MNKKASPETAVATQLATALQMRGPAEAASNTAASRGTEVVPALVAQRESIASINGSPRVLAQRMQITDAAVPATDRTALQNAPQSTVQRQQQGAPAVQPNHTGIPDHLKNGAEALSGVSLSDVRVHYDSAKPAQMFSHAYAQGPDIHVAPGQSAHLSHEVWHVVQQKQGRVKPTAQVNGVAVNDSPSLEREADVMGNAALHRGAAPVQAKRDGKARATRGGVLQARFYEWNPDGETEDEKHIWHYGPVIGLLWAEKKNSRGEPELYQGYGVWVRKLTQAHLSQQVDEAVRNHTPPQLQQGYQQIEHLTVEFAEVRDEVLGLRGAVSEHGEVQRDLVDLKALVEGYQQELGKMLKKYAAISIIGLGLAAGVSALANYFLSLPAVPWQAKVAIDIAGVLYGTYVTYRWMTTDLLPVLARAILAGGNLVVWTPVIYALVTELLKKLLGGDGFNTVHIAALPFALTIEVALRLIMAKVEAKLLADRHPDNVV